MSHPAESETGTERHQFDGETVYLMLAIVGGVITAVLWLVDLTQPNLINGGLLDITRALTILAGCGWIVRSAEARMTHRIDTVYMQGWADGFTDAAADTGAPQQRPVSHIRPVGAPTRS